MCLDTRRPMKKLVIPESNPIMAVRFVRSIWNETFFRPQIFYYPVNSKVEVTQYEPGVRYKNPLIPSEDFTSPLSNVGFHAYKLSRYRVREMKRRISYQIIIVNVALWGVVIEHRNGYRAQYMSIIL